MKRGSSSLSERVASRRAILKAGLQAGLAAGLALGTGCGLSRRGATPARKATPRYYVVLFLRGGIDAIYTTDPKSRGEVDASVDVPYAAGQIIEAGGLRLGPHLAPLRAYADRLAIVNGVAVHTANHETGSQQMVRLKTAVSTSAPALLEILGAHRDTQPLATVALGAGLWRHDHSPGWLASMQDDVPSLFEHLDQTDREEFAALARSMLAQADRLGAQSQSEQVRATASNLRQSGNLFERLREVRSFKEEVDKADAGFGKLSPPLQRALWLLQHDLTSGVFVKFMDWDSHSRNAVSQTSSSGRVMPQIAEFIRQLDTRSNAHGTLAANTTIVIGSELGRFPRLNGDLGKDHFPEAPYLLMGAGIRPGVYGQTGRSMEALPVSLDRGRPAATGHKLALDDLGATLLHLAGLDPRPYGYNGRRLSFLLANG